MNCQDIVIILFALDEMGLEKLDLKNSSSVLIDSISRLCPIFSSRNVIDCVNALDHLGFFWQDFPQEFQSEFVSCIKRCLTSLKAHERGLLMLRLSRLMVPRETLESLDFK